LAEPRPGDATNQGAEPPLDDDVGLADVAPGAGAGAAEVASVSHAEESESLFVDDLSGGAAPAPVLPVSAVPKPSSLTPAGAATGVEKAPSKGERTKAGFRTDDSGALTAAERGEKTRSSSSRTNVKDLGIAPAAERPPGSGKNKVPDPALEPRKTPVPRSGTFPAEAGASTQARRLDTNSGRRPISSDSGAVTGARPRSSEDGRSSSSVQAFPVGAKDDLSKGATIGTWKIVEALPRSPDGVLVFSVQKADGPAGGGAQLRYHPFDTFGETALDVLARAERAGAVRHDALEPVLDSGRAQAGTWFTVRGGKSLFDRLADKGRLPEDEALPLLRSAARALVTLHARGVVHGDPSPRNIIESDGVVRLGTPARALPARGTEGLVPTIMGDPRFAAPEVLDGAAPTPASDVFTVGLSLSFLLSGRTPAATDDPVEAAVLRSRLQLPALPDSAGPDIVALYTRATDEPGRRYATSDELARDVDALIEKRPITPAPPKVEAPRPTSFPPLPLAVSVLAIAVIILVLGVVFTMSTAPQDPTTEHVFTMPQGAPK
jgi:hypothetical protein